MAKESSVARNNKRIKMVEKYSAKRAELKNIASNTDLSNEERMSARKKLDKLPPNSNPIRLRNRCFVSGRSRGYINYFGLSRITFREMAHKGLLPGVKKSSW